LGDDHGLRDGSVYTQGLEENEGNTRHSKERVHLNAKGACEEGGPDVPPSLLIEVDGGEEKENGKAVVKHAQHENAVQSLRENQQREYRERRLLSSEDAVRTGIKTCLCGFIALHDDPEGG
jgi:hypothetical protein